MEGDDEGGTVRAWFGMSVAGFWRMLVSWWGSAGPAGLWSFGPGRD
jgi:hypothetical protein